VCVHVCVNMCVYVFVRSKACVPQCVCVCVLSTDLDAGMHLNRMSVDTIIQLYRNSMALIS